MKSTTEGYSSSLEGKVLLERYRMGKRVSRGGMAWLFKGWDLRDEKPVAVKILFPHFAEDPVLRMRFVKEADVQKVLEHPNIVRVISLVEEENLLGSVMEWVEGEDLKQAIRRHNAPFPLSEVLTLTVPILSALGYAHANGLVHRDIKPANILLSWEQGFPIPRLIDFGIAKLLEESEGDAMTSTGTALGTMRYMSPEQIRDSKNVDHRADIYSIGVVLYQLATGTPPFSGSNENLMFQQIYENPKPPREHCSSIPFALEQVILRCLQKKPEDRFESCPVLVSAIQEAIPGSLPEQQTAFEVRSSASEQEFSSEVRNQSLHSPEVGYQEVSSGELPSGVLEEQGYAFHADNSGHRLPSEQHYPMNLHQNHSSSGVNSPLRKKPHVKPRAPLHTMQLQEPFEPSQPKPQAVRPSRPQANTIFTGNIVAKSNELPLRTPRKPANTIYTGDLTALPEQAKPRPSRPLANTIYTGDMVAHSEPQAVPAMDSLPASLPSSRVQAAQQPLATMEESFFYKGNSSETVVQASGQGQLTPFPESSAMPADRPFLPNQRINAGVSYQSPQSEMGGNEKNAEQTPMHWSRPFGLGVGLVIVIGAIIFALLPSETKMMQSKLPSRKTKTMQLKLPSLKTNLKRGALPNRQKNGILPNQQSGACQTGQVRSCYPKGRGKSQGKGRCQAGRQRCSGKKWGACLGAILPMKEVCNGIDDDCDGCIDESIEGMGRNCVRRVSGCRYRGQTKCNPKSKTLYCQILPNLSLRDVRRVKIRISPSHQMFAIRYEGKRRRFRRSTCIEIHQRAKRISISAGGYSLCVFPLPYRQATWYIRMQTKGEMEPAANYCIRNK